MKSTFFLAVVVAALAALAAAKPSHAIIAALLRLGEQPGRGLHARSGINPSSISEQCQSSCTSVLQKLNVRRLFQFRIPSSPPLGLERRF